MKIAKITTISELKNGLTFCLNVNKTDPDTVYCCCCFRVCVAFNNFSEISLRFFYLGRLLSSLLVLSVCKLWQVTTVQLE